jgi:hypothetical protein
MSQESHRVYKELKPLQNRYNYLERTGPGGIREDVYQRMLLKYKYEFLKKKFEYLSIRKYDSYMKEISYAHHWSWLSDEEDTLINNKMKNDTELFLLHRHIKILEIKLKIKL